MVNQLPWVWLIFGSLLNVKLKIMKTNSKVGRTQDMGERIQEEVASVPHRGLSNQTIVFSYDSMQAEVEKIKHPASFEFLRDFYGITNEDF